MLLRFFKYITGFFCRYFGYADVKRHFSEQCALNMPIHLLGIFDYNQPQTFEFNIILCYFKSNDNGK